MRLAVSVLLGLALVVSLGGLYWLTHRPHAYRYKVTVEVETPEGPRIGSAVREIRQRGGPQITPEADMAHMTERGEAVAVDLPRGQVLFALLSPDVQQTVNSAFGAGLESKLAAQKDRRLITLQPPPRPEATWGESGYPRLVRFRNLDDPGTAEKIDPARLADTFGAGVRLKRITAQMTEEPVTAAIDARLRWLGSYRSKMLDGERFHHVQSKLTASHLNSLAFKRSDE